jgi:hypothetical protein
MGGGYALLPSIRSVATKEDRDKGILPIFAKLAKLAP